MSLEHDRQIRRRSKDHTRRDILDTALQMIIDDGVTEQIDIRLSTVLDHMGLTSGAAYNIWPSQGEFQHDLAHHLAREYTWAGPDQSELKIDFEAPDPMVEIRRLAELYLDSLTDHTQFYLALRLWGVKDPTPDLIDSVRASYAVNHDLWCLFYQVGFEWAGRRLRDQYTLDDFVVMATMVTEGAALRHRFEPERLMTAGDRNLYSEILVAMVERFTEPAIESTEEFDDES